jgi:hypothetical protein
MTTTLWLRISSIVSLLFAGGHALGGRKDWSPLGETEVLRTMRDVRFDVMGVSRTYLDFYKGFGHLLTVSTVLQAVLLWQMASLSKTDPARLRPMIGAFVLATIAGGVLCSRFIFPVPVVFSAVLAACLTAAFFLAR